jgi:YVTN family beta-propeller protein
MAPPSQSGQTRKGYRRSQMPRTAALLAALLSTAALASPAPAVPSHHVAEVIAGPDGAWDYARVDASTRQLYVARGDAVTKVDLASGQATSFGAVKRGHAALPLSGGRLLVTSGNDGTVRFFDAAGKQLANLAVGKKPDAAILDASGKRAFVMNADSGSISVIDTAAMRVTATITAKPGLEYAALSGNTLFVNDEDLGEIETIDLARGMMGKPIAMPGCEEPSGLGLDARHARLIAACANGKGAIVDARTRRLLALVDIGRGPDAVIIDQARGLAFIPCGKDGVLDVFSLAAAGEVTRVGRVPTEPGARTGALDPETGAIYLPTAKLGAPSEPGGRPVPLAGTFHILVVRPS